MKYLLILLLSSITLNVFSQNNNTANTKTIEVNIESGVTLKEYKAGKLEKIAVGMYAMNYGNTLTFTKNDQVITIKDAQSPDITIQIYFENGKQNRALLFKNKPISSWKIIDFDIQNLPKNSNITRYYEQNQNFHIIQKTYFEALDAAENNNLDKSFKLFGRLEMYSNLTNIDTIFNTLATFFSQEDALLRIYYGKYAEKFMPLLSANIETDALGKIKEGIIWTERKNQKGDYQVYKNNKIIKTVTANLTEFQQILLDYKMEQSEIIE